MNSGLENILRIVGGLVLVLVTLSIVSGISPLPIAINKVQAQVGTMTLSSDRINPVKWIVLTVTGYEPGSGINTINIRATYADTGAVINVNWSDGTIKNYFTANRVGGTTFVAYVGGPMVANITPAYPLPGVTNASSFARLLLDQVNDVNKTIVFTVIGTGITATVKFEPVAPTILPIPDTPYRRDVRLSIQIKDPDLNKDPTNIDAINVTNNSILNVNITTTLTISYNSTTQILNITGSGNLITLAGLAWYNYIYPGTIRILINLIDYSGGPQVLVDSPYRTSVGLFNATISRIDYVNGNFSFFLSLPGINVTGSDPRVQAYANFTYMSDDDGSVSNISARITLIKAPESGGGSYQTGWIPLNRILLPGVTRINETGVDTGVFNITTSIKVLSWVANKSAGYPEYPAISSNDRIVIELSTTSRLQSGSPYPSQWNDRDKGQGVTNAVYTQPQINIVFKSTGITVDIVSPDDNVNPTVKDFLDDGIDYGLDTSYVLVGVREINTGTWLTINPADPSGNRVYFPLTLLSITEKDLDVGIYEFNLSVRWAANVSDARAKNSNIDTTRTAYYPINFPPDVDARLRIYVYYTTLGKRYSGYNIDQLSVADYIPTKANITLNKATTKTWDFTIIKPAINNDANSVEILTPQLITAPNGLSGYAMISSSSGVPVAIIQIVDSAGGLVNIPAGAISFSETDFDSGVFRLVINATQITPLVAGGQYVLRYWDLAGFSITRGLIEFPFTIRGVAITFPGRADVPINRVYGVYVPISYANDAYNRDPTAYDSANVYVQITYVNGTTVTLYGPGGILGTAFTLGETDIDTGEFSGFLFLPPGLFSTPAIIDANLTVYDPLYVLPDGSNPRASIKIRPHAPTEFTINDSTAVTLRMGDAIVIRLVEPDWNWRTFRIDYVTVTVVPPRGSPFNITLTETGTNTGVFVARIVVSWDDFNGTSFNGNVFPGDTVEIRYNDDTPVLSPTASSWTTVPFVIQFKVQSTTGRIVPETSEPGFVGPLEMFNVTVIDPDLDRFVDRADLYSPDNYVALRGGIIALSIEGLPQVVYYPLNETGLHTGTFRSVTGLSIIDVLRENNIILPTDDAWTKAAKVAQFIGKKVLVSYIDMIDETGSRNVVNAILTIKAVDASIATDKDFVNIGETLTITVYNKDIAGTDVPEYKQVFVSSTMIAVPQPFFLTEVAPGVFQINITVVSPSDWIPGAPQIPARLGDTITITYYDPVTANGSSRVVFTKQVIVGRFLERPARVNSVDLLDPTTGAPVLPRVGVPVLIAVNLSNIDVIDRQMTAFVVVRDANNVTVAIFFTTTTVPAGRSVVVGFSWIPFAAGSYTIEVLVFKLVTDRTPLAPDVFRRTITVSS